MFKFIRSIRSNIITGILIVLPLVTTAYVVFKLFDLVDSFLPTLFHGLLGIPKDWVPGVGVLIILIGAYFIGISAKNYFGNKLIELGNSVISSIPFLNKIYIGLQQILDAVVNRQNKKLFERAVLLEYPKANCYSIGFVTSDTTGEIPTKLGRPMVSVFIPTTPNPTSGFLLFLPESEVVDLDMGVETAIKLVMSAGMVNSDQLKKTQHLYTGKKPFKKWKLFGSKSRSEFHDPRD